MEFVNPTELLTHFGIVAPTVRFLIPNNEQYHVLHFQPKGHLQISEERLGPDTTEEYLTKFRGFFTLANDNQPDLAIAPEYSCPISIVREFILNNWSPDQGKLWVIGTESVTIPELTQLKENLAPFCEIVWDPTVPNEPGHFVDPIFYFFRTQTSSSPSKCVALVQFKTTPMGDRLQVEQHNMTRGSKIYVFNKGNEHTLKFLTLICSDSLSADIQNELHQVSETRVVTQFHHCIVLHVQANPSPRHPDFRRYREGCFSLNEQESEIMCVNWAHGTTSDPPQYFQNHKFTGSAVYFKAPEMEHTLSDDLANKNHRLGLYSTYLHEGRAYVFFFNFIEAIYHFTNRKPWQPGQATLGHRNGPRAEETFTWKNHSWTNTAELPDDFSVMCGDNTFLRPLYETNYLPTNVERLINISCGLVRNRNWYLTREMETCRIDWTEKIVKLTFAQDRRTDPPESRTELLSNYSELLSVLRDKKPWPRWLTHVRDQVYRLEFDLQNPNTNFVTESGYRATLVHVGSANQEILGRANKTLENLMPNRQQVKLKSKSVKFAIWYRKNGKIELFESNRVPKFNNAERLDSTDFRRGRDDA